MKYLLFGLIISSLIACSSPQTTKNESVEQNNVVSTDEFEIHYAKEQATTLFVFPCFTCDLAHTKMEFDLLDSAYEGGISVVLLNYNLHLSLDTNEAEALRIYINEIINYYQLPTEHIYFGGYSGGGNVALLLSNYLIEKQNTYLPTGVFAVDPPIDLWNIYQSSLLNIERNFSAPSVQESELLISILDSLSGEDPISAETFTQFSPIVNELNSYENINHLKDLKVRLYTEPDSLWWKENRQADFNQTNSYALQILTKNQSEVFESLELIETQEKGYRADGRRHPHSWSIIDIADLIRWINTPQ
jgi:hypothetical protein